MPTARLEYLIYTADCSLLEKNILKCYESDRTHLNHEWIVDIPVHQIINTCKQLINLLHISVTEEKNLEAYNKNI